LSNAQSNIRNSNSILATTSKFLSKLFKSDIKLDTQSFEPTITLSKQGIRNTVLDLGDPNYISVSLRSSEEYKELSTEEKENITFLLSLNSANNPAKKNK